MPEEFLTSIPSGKSFLGLIELATGVDIINYPGVTRYNSYGSVWAPGSDSAQFDGIHVSGARYGYVKLAPDFNVIKEATLLCLP